MRGRVVTLCLQLVELDSTEVLAVGYSSSTISFYCSTSHLEEQKEFPQLIQFLPEEAPREKAELLMTDPEKPFMIQRFHFIRNSKI